MFSYSVFGTMYPCWIRARLLVIHHFCCGKGKVADEKREMFTPFRMVMIWIQYNVHHTKINVIDFFVALRRPCWSHGYVPLTAR